MGGISCLFRLWRWNRYRHREREPSTTKVGTTAMMMALSLRLASEDIRKQSQQCSISTDTMTDTAAVCINYTKIKVQRGFSYSQGAFLAGWAYQQLLQGGIPQARAIHLVPHILLQLIHGSVGIWWHPGWGGQPEPSQAIQKLSWERGTLAPSLTPRPATQPLLLCDGSTHCQQVQNPLLAVVIEEKLHGKMEDTEAHH
ncbi:MAG: hypothetical protein FRX49_10421 [Trebouxia sp. A1-2]|nr:MAG: hypothetical protein FRX49_10421 [Trebouxia sp. A1-2]